MRRTSSMGSLELEQVLTDGALDCGVIVPKDQIFLWQHLQTKLVRCNVTGEAAQHNGEHVVAARMALRPEADGDVRVTERFLRRGKFAFLLHDGSGPLGTSWTWLCLVRTLYKSGFSVILLDLPGMGASIVSGNCDGAEAEWEEHGASVLVQVMDALRIPKCHLVTCGASCSALIRMVKSAPNRIEGEHILHNPVLDCKQCGKLSGLLKNSGIRALVTLDKDNPGRAHAAHDYCLDIQADGSSNAALSLMCLRDDEMNKVHTNTSVPIALLVPSKSVAHSYATFLDQGKSKIALSPSPSKAGSSSPLRGSLADALGDSKPVSGIWKKARPSKEKSASHVSFAQCAVSSSEQVQPSQKQSLPRLVSDTTPFRKWQRSGSLPVQPSKRHIGHGANLVVKSEMGKTSQEPSLSLPSPLGGRTMQVVG